MSSQVSSDRAVPRHSPVVVLLAAVVLVAATALCYWAWVGSAEIPYPGWRVAGCVVTLVLLAVGAGVGVRAWLPAAVMPLALTVAWSVPAARTDETGLWGVGAILMLLGSLLAAGVLSVVVLVVRGVLSGRPRRG